MEQYYRPSGKINPLYFVLFAFGAVLVAVLSVLYAIGMFYMPSIYLCVLVTLAMAAASGFVAAKAAEWGKARNSLVWWLALLVYFAVFVFIHLTAYVAVIFSEEGQIIDLEGFWILFKDPAYTYELFADWIVPYGVWTFTSGSSSASGGDTVSGMFLVGIWVIEHLLVFGGSVLVFRSVLRKPFFEETGRWGVEKTSAFAWEHQPESSLGAIREALESGRLDYFRALKPAGESSQYCRLSCYTDPLGGNDSVYLCLTNISVTLDKKGKEKRAEKALIRNLNFSEQSYRRLELFAKEAGEAPPEEAPEETPEGTEAEIL